MTVGFTHGNCHNELRLVQDDRDVKVTIDGNRHCESPNAFERELARAFSKILNKFLMDARLIVPGILRSGTGKFIGEAEDAVKRFLS